MFFNGWIGKLCYIYMMQYFYSPIRRNKILIDITSWMNEYIYSLNSQHFKHKFHWVLETFFLLPDNIFYFWHVVSLRLLTFPLFFFLFKNDANCSLYFYFINLWVFINLLWSLWRYKYVLFWWEMLDQRYININRRKAPFMYLNCLRNSRKTAWEWTGISPQWPFGMWPRYRETCGLIDS